MIPWLLLVESVGRAWATDTTPSIGPNPPVQVEVGYVHEVLSNGSPDWREEYLDFKKIYAPRTILYGTLRLAERFGLSDSEFTLGGYYPLDSHWTAIVEGSLSPSHNVLPSWSAMGQLYRDLGGGWGMQFGLRHREYTASTVDMDTLMIERYWEDYRAAYTATVSQISGAGSVWSHTLQINYYASDRSTVGLILSAGQEAESAGPGVVLVSTVRSADFIAALWLNHDLAVTIGIGVHDQAPFYTRTRMQLGLRWQF